MILFNLCSAAFRSSNLSKLSVCLGYLHRAVRVYVVLYQNSFSFDSHSLFFVVSSITVVFISFCRNWCLLFCVRYDIYPNEDNIIHIALQQQRKHTKIKQHLSHRRNNYVFVDIVGDTQIGLVIKWYVVFSCFCVKEIFPSK